LAAVSAEYGMSLARILWHPRGFDGNAPDVRWKVAGIYHRVLRTDDPNFEGGQGYMLGTEFEYQMLSWFSTTVRSYAEKRHMSIGPWRAVIVSPGLVFKSDWQSRDRIELAYSRSFYSRAADINDAEPLDHDIFILGGTMSF